MKKQIVIVGLGKISQEVKFFIDEYELFEVIGYSVNKEYMTANIHNDGLPIYPLEELDKYIDKENVYTFVAASQFNYLHSVKRDLYLYLKEHKYKVANLISPKADIHIENIGDGNWINDYAYIHHDAQIGSNNVFRPYSYLAHYSKVGDHNFIGVRSTIGGSSTIGNQCFIGLSATIINSVKIGDKCIIGAGTLIKKNVADYCLVKLSDATVKVTQYTSTTIENKLAPGLYNNRKYYSTEE